MGFAGQDFFSVCSVVAGFSLAAEPNGTGFTVVPSRTFWMPSATTLSPGLNGPLMTHISPSKAPVVTGVARRLLEVLADLGI